MKTTNNGNTNNSNLEPHSDARLDVKQSRFHFIKKSVQNCQNLKSKSKKFVGIRKKNFCVVAAIELVPISVASMMRRWVSLKLVLSK